MNSPTVERRTPVRHAVLIAVMCLVLGFAAALPSGFYAGYGKALLDVREAVRKAKPASKSQPAKQPQRRIRPGEGCFRA